MTIREIAHSTSQDIHNFELYKGDFLDGFYRSDSEQRKKMIKQEPDFYDNMPVRILPFLAGMVEKLCNDYFLECPEMVYKERYFLQEPSFGMDAKGRLRILMLVESPAEFKIRNVFTTNNCLTRV